MLAFFCKYIMYIVFFVLKACITSKTVFNRKYYLIFFIEAITDKATDLEKKTVIILFYVLRVYTFY